MRSLSILLRDANEVKGTRDSKICNKSGAEEQKKSLGAVETPTNSPTSRLSRQFSRATGFDTRSKDVFDTHVVF